MRSLLQAINDLHAAELYDDVIFCAALRLQEHLLDDELNDSEQALLFKLIGDAYYQTDCYFQSIKYYERASEIIRQLPRNSYPKTISQAELRYLIHKALMREKNYEEAIKVLNAIPKTEHTPKTRSALAKLLTTRLSKQQSKNEIIACHAFVHQHYPNSALYTQNELLKLGHSAVKRSINNLQIDEDPANVAFFKAKALVNEFKPLEAISILQRHHRPNAKLSLELANLYNFVGNRSSSINSLERLRSIDAYCIRGMDLLAGLYYANQVTNNASNELESLVGYLSECHPNEPETYVALAYLSKHQNRNKEALLFAQRALIIAKPGKDKAHAALLRALILIENKNYETADQFLDNILKFDDQNIDAWELRIRANLQRKAFEAAKLQGIACKKIIGVDNPRAVFLYAQAIFNQTSMKDECENCLKELVERSPYLTDAVVMLSKLFDQQQKYKTAIPMLKKAANFNLNPIIQTILEDLNAKSKKTVINSYRHSISSQNDTSDPFVLHSLNASPASFATTPDCGIVPIGIASVRAPPRRQRSHAVRQPGSLDLMQRLDFTDSLESDTASPDLFTNAGGYSFQTPTAGTAYIDDLDEDVIDVGTTTTRR